MIGRCFKITILTILWGSATYLFCVVNWRLFLGLILAGWAVNYYKGTDVHGQPLDSPLNRAERLKKKLGQINSAARARGRGGDANDK